MKRLPLFCVFSCLLVLILLSGISCSDNAGINDNDNGVAKSGPVEVTVHSVSAFPDQRDNEQPEGTDVLKDNIYLELDTTVMNISDEEVVVADRYSNNISYELKKSDEQFSYIYFHLRNDATGWGYSESAGSYFSYNLLGGKALAPTESISGAITFHVPVDFDVMILEVLQYKYSGTEVIEEIEISRDDISNLI